MNLPCNLRLFWLREPGIGVLRAGRLPDTEAGAEKLSAVLAEAAGLSPEAASLLAEKVLSAVPKAGEIRRAADTLEVQFPFLGRKAWKQRASLVADYVPCVDEEGRILLQHPEGSALETDGYNGYAAGLPGASTDFSFSFTDRRSLAPLQAKIWLPTLLAGYGFTADEISSLEIEQGGRIGASITVSLPGACGAAWLLAPKERDAEFFDTYVRVSKAVQSALRRWLPYTWFRDAECYANQEFGVPLAVYGATRPYRGKPSSMFTFDVLNTELVDLFFRLAARDVEPLAERVASALVDSGRPEIAELYSYARGKSLVEITYKRRRSINSLLVADSVLHEALVKLGHDGKAIRRAAGPDTRPTIRSLSAACDGFLAAWNGRLKRLYAAQDFRAFGSLFFIEATHALCPGAALKVTARITTPAGTRVLVSEGRSPESF